MVTRLNQQSPTYASKVVARAVHRNQEQIACTKAGAWECQSFAPHPNAYV